MKPSIGEKKAQMLKIGNKELEKTKVNERKSKS